MKKYLICLIISACFVHLGVLHAETTDRSDKMVPRWVKHTPKSENPNLVYRVVQVYVDRLSDMHSKSIEELTNYVPQTWNVDRFAGWQVGKEGSNEIQVRVEGTVANMPMHCKEIDSYWVREYMGGTIKYRCYVLYQVVRPGEYATEFTRLTDKYGFGAVALSIIPGAGQMYKGSYLKGGLIMGSSILCAGGIVLCESNKSIYQGFANKEHNATKKLNYQTKANNWATGSYICIGALAGLWIYNIIDAAVASGARRMVVDKTFKGYSWEMTPTMLDPYSVALTTTIHF